MRTALAGVVSVITLLQAEADESVGALMDSDPVCVSADADLTDIALLMADFNLYSIPVVDEQDHVLGVVTVDDVLEATIPEDWRRREPAPRPVREITTMSTLRYRAVTLRDLERRQDRRHRRAARPRRGGRAAAQRRARHGAPG